MKSINTTLGLLVLIMLPVSLILGSNQTKIISQDLEPYSKISLNGNFRVTLIQGNKEHIVLEGKEQVINHIEIKEKDGRVTIQRENEHHAKGMKKMHITLYFRKLEQLELNGISELLCHTPIRSDELKIDCNGIKDIDMHLEVGHLKATFNGVGRTFLTGSAKTADLSYMGIGNLEAFDLLTEQMNVESAGIGRVEVHATKELIVEATGIGSVWYIGEPAIKKFDGTGIGKIKRARL